MQPTLTALIVVTCLAGCGSSSDDDVSAPVETDNSAVTVPGTVVSSDPDTVPGTVEGNDPGTISGQVPANDGTNGADGDGTGDNTGSGTTGGGTPPDDGADPAPAPAASSALITLDNHVALLQNVFAVYSGKLYGDDILTAPDYSDPAYDGVPQSNGPDLISTPVDITCSNGGTARFVPETTGFFTDNTLTWNFEFDNCQDGGNLLDGQLRREIYEEVTLTSSGFSNDMQTQVQRFSGRIYRTYYGGGTGDRSRFWQTTDADYSLTGSTGNFSLTDSTTSLSTSSGRGELMGGFQVTADWTDNRPVTVRTVSALTLERDAGLADNTIQFESGQLEISAGADNVLLLDAATGDIDTVSVTLTVNGTSETVIEPWAPWISSLIFDSVSGY